MLLSNKYFKTGIAVLLCLFLFNSNLLSQNLIRNGSFEVYNTPVNWNNWGGDFVDYSVFPAQQILLEWDEQNSADCFLSACTHTYADAPENRFGYIDAKNGTNYVGLQLCPKSYTYEVKEYMHQQLTSPLQAGKSYCLSFYVSKADRKEYAIKNIGAYFSINPVSTGTLGYIAVTPQVENQNGFITDTVNWIQIQGCFTAIGGEQHITIGNFNSNANTDTLYTGTNNPIVGNPEYAYYYIDDIQLWDALTTGVEDLSGNIVSVYPNPANNISTIKSDTEIERIEITNVTGQVLLTELVYQKEHQLKLDIFAEGIYFVKIIYPNGLRVTRKIIVNH